MPLLSHVMVYVSVPPVFFATFIAVNRFIFAVAPAEGAHGLRAVINLRCLGYDCHFMASVAPANVMYLFNAVNAHIVNSFENIAPSGAWVGSLGEGESSCGRLTPPLPLIGRYYYYWFFCFHFRFKAIDGFI